MRDRRDAAGPAHSRWRRFLLALAVAALLVLAGTQAGLIRWRLPDQGAMATYLRSSPIAEMEQVERVEVTSDGENHRVCFMCSTFGVSGRYYLGKDASTSDDDLRSLCSEVLAVVTEWQRGAATVAGPTFAPGRCTMTVEEVPSHPEWRLRVDVLLLKVDATGEVDHNFLPRVVAAIDEPGAG